MAHGCKAVPFTFLQKPLVFGGYDFHFLTSVSFHFHFLIVLRPFAWRRLDYVYMESNCRVRLDYFVVVCLS